MLKYVIIWGWDIYPHLSIFEGECFGKLIEVTKLNGVKILVNPTLFETVEETPDTVITLTTGKKIIVKESRQDIKNLVKLYRKDIFAE